MRASAIWRNRHSERFAPRAVRRGIAHLPHYACEYLMVGRGDPIILVPGLAGGYELAGRLMRVLASQFTVISYELRGEHDPFRTRQPNGLADLAQDLSDLQRALLLEQPAVLGISFGSAIALEFALRHSNQATKFILHGIDAQFGDSLGGRIARMALSEFPLPHDNPFINQFFRLLFARRESTGSLVNFVSSQCWKTEQSAMAQRLELLAEFDVRDRIAEITAPTLVIGGQDDHIVDSNRQRALAESLPSGRFACLSGAGHLCFLTQPLAFARAVFEFLEVQPADELGRIDSNQSI